MQKIFFSTLIILTVLLTFSKKTFCQVDEDSVMVANSERLKAEQNKGLTGLSEPAFGTYKTEKIQKTNSGVSRKRIKDNTEMGIEFSGSGTNFEQTKYLTKTKRVAFQLILSGAYDTCLASFSFSSISKEKKPTFLSKILRKQDDNDLDDNQPQDEVLSYDRTIDGKIRTGKDSIQWDFNISHLTGKASISSGYLKNDQDSLNMQTYSSFSADLVLVNNKGEHLAALKFKQKPLYIWIRNDLSHSYREGIAGLFAVIIAIKDY